MVTNFWLILNSYNANSIVGIVCAVREADLVFSAGRFSVDDKLKI